MQYFIDGFRNYANFEGRSTRKQYWMFILFYLLLAFIAFIFSQAGLPYFELAFWAITFVPYIAYTARRLHDAGHSGWWQLLCLIPIVGPFIVILMLLQGSAPANKYGIFPHQVTQHRGLRD